MPDSLIRTMETIAYRSKNRLVNLFDPPVIVLLYHRITTLNADPQLLAVTPDNFRQHLQFLKNNFTLVRFEEDWSKIKNTAIAITFDDGYADNAREALPILEDIGVPATFFVSTGNIDTHREFWWDELGYIILDDREFPEQFVLADGNFEQVWPTATSAERRALYDHVLSLMVKINAHRRENLLKQLRQWVHADDETVCLTHRSMTVEELQHLARSSWVTIGAHSVTHAALSSLTPDEQREEIIGSQKMLETWLGKEIKVFSYPFGNRADYTQETVELCKKAGFIKVAANFPAQVHSWTDPYQIPRQLVRNWPLEVFVEKFKGFCIL